MSVLEKFVVKILSKYLGEYVEGLFFLASKVYHRVNNVM